MQEKLVTLFNNFILRQFGSCLIKKNRKFSGVSWIEDEVGKEVVEHPRLFTTELLH